MKYFFFLSICVFQFQFAFATHIIGGSMSYSYAGNDNYLIQLEVLRDCASAGADFDNPASIGIFDTDGNLVRQLFVTHSGIDLISTDPTNICIFPPNVCVERTYYQVSTSLPFIEGGYTISYQRCCRSHQIVNLADPGNNGMTFHTHIDTDLHNSSPLFVGEFPYAVYVNTPFSYRVSTIDPDGDSLAYVLSVPFFGGDLINIQPQPPAPPPYMQGSFKSPYSVENMLGGDYPLTMNPVTGEMTAIPSTTGIFQIAYAVKEFRNGELIGTYYREFAFVVTYPFPDIKYNVRGSVLINDSIPLDLGKVQIFQRDITTDSLYLYNEQSIGSGATYSFQNIPAGIFYIKAVIDTASTYMDQYLPTYYTSVYFWYNAMTINQCDTSPFSRDIHLINVDSFDGIHILDGTVNFAGRGLTPVPGLNLLLAGEDGKIIRARTTDDDGYFKFEHLPQGEYQLFVDLINSLIDNHHPPRIELNKNRTVEVYLYKDSLSLQEPTSIALIDKKDVLQINLYPNPTSDKFVLDVNIQKDKLVSYEILDMNGHMMQSGKMQTNLAEQISIADLATGVYIIKIKEDGLYAFRKIVKNKY